MDYWLNAPIQLVKVHEDLEEFVWSKVTNHIINVEEVMKALDIYLDIIWPDLVKKATDAIKGIWEGLR